MSQCLRTILRRTCIVAVAAAGCTPRVPVDSLGRAQHVGPSLSPRLDSAHAVLFPEDRAPSLLQQCSRPIPDDVVGYWTPTDSQLAALEAGLPHLLRGDLSAAAPGSVPSPILGEYYRQYAGIVHHDGRRTVYVNGFSRALVAERARFLEENRDHPERLTHFPPEFRGPTWWHGVAEVVCDGGSAAFGVEFDPATDTFSGLAFNGQR